MTHARTRLTLGPVLFNWPADRWRDFHFRIADEAPVDVVYVGEVVCSKRAPFIVDDLPAVIERLAAGGKEVVLSSPILPTSARERAAMRDLAAMDGVMVEANDVGALALLGGRPHAVGPFVNVYDESTLRWVAGRGTVSVTLNSEIPADSIGVIALAAGASGTAVEAAVFGRMPLAISARCYDARSQGLHKDGCRFVCVDDPDGMPVDTLDGQAFLAVNGTQTLSRGYLCLAGSLDDLARCGVSRFRLWPHSVDMMRVAAGFRDALDGRRDGRDLEAEITALLVGEPVVDGFLYGSAGAAAVG